MVNVAINGFGRIGRNTLRAAIREGIFDKINYVATLLWVNLTVKLKHTKKALS